MDDQSHTVTLDDIAREAGVSVSTVSRALSGNPAVNSQTRERIRTLAEAGGYDAPPRRSRAAVRLKSVGRPTISIVLAPPLQAMPKPFDPFSLALIGGIGAAMRERKLNLTISPMVPNDQASLTRFFEEDESDGAILLGQSELHSALNTMAKNGRRAIVWGAEVPDQHYCSVGSDNLRGGQRAAAHLARLGRRRIAFVGSASGIELRQRREGYEAALQEAGLALDPALQRSCPLNPDGAVEAVDDMLDEGVKFDAIVAASDLVAIGALRALARRGISTPHDVAVVGYDDIDIAGHTHPTLTTIRQDTGKAGRLLVSKVLRMLEGQQASSERLTTELIVRESCGA